MLNKSLQYLFKRPDEIGLDNYLVLIFCSLTAALSILATFINIGIHLGGLTIICSAATAVIFSILYFYSWKKGKYILSKYLVIIIGIILLNVQWFINYGSTGPILYLFVVVESFIIVFFTKKDKYVFTLIVFVNVTILFYIEYRFPATIGRYASESSRLIDLYTGLLIYLVLSILLLNIAIRFYITQREKAQLADKLKSAFLANMSHEIRTPMNGILGFAELLKEPNISGEEQQEFINVIETSGERMLNIINNIIDISKIEAGLMKVDIRETNINELTAYIYTFFKPEADNKGIELSAINSLPSAESVIITDNEKLYAILINLVKNAIKFTNEGSIKFGYHKKTNSQVSELEFFVQDTGIGIPKDRQDAVFERFIQADIFDRSAYQGAGLGLSIAKAYVEMLGGKIHVESEPGKGTTFYFTIPYNNVTIEKTVVENSGGCGEGKNQIRRLKILIVEDDLASEMLLIREVKLFCREVLKIRTGKGAIEACRNNPDIDLILMDIQIPDMNGYDATKEIRKFNEKVIIIAQTAYALSGDREKAIEAGCNDYISKPIHYGVLQSIILEHFT